MNHVRIVGEVLDIIETHDELIYTVRTRRSGKKEVFEEIAVILTTPLTLEIGEVYDFSGILGIYRQIRAESWIDVCAYVYAVYNTESGVKLYSEVGLSGVIASIERHPKIPNKISFLLNADDGSYDKYKVAVWGKRLPFIEHRNAGDRVSISGELVKYVYSQYNKSYIRTEIAFWRDEQQP